MPASMRGSPGAAPEYSMWAPLWKPNSVTGMRFWEVLVMPKTRSKRTVSRGILIGVLSEPAERRVLF